MAPSKTEIIDAALNTKGIISIEENNVRGGLGSAIAELLCNENIYPNYFKSIDKNQLKPKAVIANTVKGKGFSFSENNNDWHHSILTKKLYDKALEELELNK